MKKSEMSITMPLTTYEEFMQIKTKYENLIEKLLECYDTINFKINPAESIRFDIEKAIKITKEFLPYSYMDAKISF